MAAWRADTHAEAREIAGEGVGWEQRGGAIAEADGPGYVILNSSSRLREITGAALHLGTSPWERGAPHPPCMMLPP